jgi:capsular exopolysaccharide synthesis family protein
MAVNENAELEEMIRNATGGGNTNVPAAAEPEEESVGGGIDLPLLLSVTRRSLPWMVLLVLLGLAASWTYLRYTKPVYQSSSTIKIDERQEADRLGLGALGAAADQRQNISKLAGEVELIKSDLIYSRLRDSLPLDVNYYAEGTVLETELYNASPFKVEYTVREPIQYNRKFTVRVLDAERFRLSYLLGQQEVDGEYRFGQPVTTPGFTLRLTPTRLFNSQTPESSFYFVINDAGSINGYLSSNLAVNVINPEANTVGIIFTDHNPLKARDIVNKIDSVYLQVKLARNNQATQQTLAFLEGQLLENRQRLSGAELNLQDFVRRSKTYDAKADLAILTGQLTELQKERELLERRASVLADLNALVRRERVTADDEATVEQSIPGLATLQDPQLTQQIALLNEQQREMRKILQSYQPNATTAIRIKEDQLRRTQASIQKLLQQNLQLVQKEIRDLDRRSGEFNSQLLSLPGKETELARLRRPLELYDKTYQTLMEKMIDFNIQKAGTTADFQILSPASLPGAPIFPIKLMVYAIGLAVGAMLGLGLVAGRYLLHNTVTNIRELERNSVAPVLGIVPSYEKEKLSVSKLIVDKNPKSSISEAIRSIRTNLEFVATSKQKRLISITSTISGEGKTFVAVNLGGIIALSDQRVIIIDLDMRKPKVNLAFDAENTKGVSTILIDRHSVQECIQRTNIPTLDFISAGPTPPNPSELILHPQFDRMLEELKQNYDVIIIDTPPVGLVTDGVLIMRKVDVPIYIVRAGYSKKTFLKNINKLVRGSGFNKLTTILNDAQAGGMYGYGYGYGYGYSYGYGNGYGYYEDTKAPTGLLARLRRRFS